MKKEDRARTKNYTRNTRRQSAKTQTRQGGGTQPEFTPPLPNLKPSTRWGSLETFDRDRFRSETFTLHESGENVELVRDLDGQLFFACFTNASDRIQAVVYEASYQVTQQWLSHEFKNLKLTPEKFLRFHGINAPTAPAVSQSDPPWMQLESAVNKAVAILDLMSNNLAQHVSVQLCATAGVSSDGIIRIAQQTADDLRTAFQKQHEHAQEIFQQLRIKELQLSVSAAKHSKEGAGE